MGSVTLVIIYIPVVYLEIRFTSKIFSLKSDIDALEYKYIRNETKKVLENKEKKYSDKLIEMNYKYLDQYYYQIISREWKKRD